MGFYSTTLEPKTAPRKTPSCASKTASREFFSYPIKTDYKKSHNPLKTSQKNRLATPKTASGIPYWPSRDPIEEIGGVNLYGYCINDPFNWWDYLGLQFTDPAGGKPWEAIYDSAKQAIAAGSMYASNASKYMKQLPIKRNKKKYEPKPAIELEYCGRVCYKKGTKKFYFAQIHKGASGGCRMPDSPPCKKGDTQVGTYHNHPILGDQSNTYFSSNDKNVANTGAAYKQDSKNETKDIPPNPMGLGYEYEGESIVKIYDNETKGQEKWKQNKKGKWVHYSVLKGGRWLPIK
jgi:hypothetical protein